LKNCPSIAPYVEIEKLRSARNNLDSWFPGIEKLRNALSHQGENEAHPAIHAPDGIRHFSRLVNDDTFLKAYEGKEYGISISKKSLGKLDEIVSLYFEGFELAAKTLEQQGHLE
jgi:hypothetical protein